MIRKTTIYATIVACSINLNVSNAQWQNYTSIPGNTFNEPDNTTGLNIESIGIGQFNAFGVPNYPLSAIHVNTNLFSFTPSYQAGEVFRTDCSIENSTYWRMFKGAPDVTTEYGTLYSLNNTDDFTLQEIHFYIQASYANDVKRDYGDIRFNNGTKNALGLGRPRMRILGLNGFVGIGDYTKFTPQSLLDVDGTITAKKIVIINENGKQDLFALITQLQKEVKQLKQELSACIEN